MAKQKKIRQKKALKNEKDEIDPIVETKKRLEQQQKALRKIIEKFSQHKNNK